MFPTLLLSFCLATSLIGGGFSQDSNEMQSLLTKAQSALRDEDYMGASDLLLGALEISPNDENVNALLGSSYLAMERADLAEGFLYTALNISNYTNVGAANNLAEALRLNGDKDLAVTLLKHTMQRTNQSDLSGMLEYSLGRIYEESDDFDSAAKWFLAAAILQPTNTLYWQSATTLGFPVHRSDLAIAEQVLAQGLSANPMHSDLLFDLGFVMQQTNRLEDACTVYEQILHIDPKYIGAAANLATGLHSLGKFDRALPVYESAVKVSPNSVMLLQNFASLLNSMGFHQNSVNVISDALAIAPDDEEVKEQESQYRKLSQGATSRKLQAQANIIEVAMKADWEGVVHQLQTSGTPAEDSSWWFFAAGMAQVFRGNHADALACCEKARSLAPTPSHLMHGCIGIANQYLSNYDEAIKHFTISRDLIVDTTYQDPLPFLGFAMEQGDIEVNLIQAFNVKGEHDTCIKRSLELLDLPPVDQGGVTILLFSFVEWTPSMRKFVNSFGFRQVKAKRLVLPKKRTLMDEAVRVRTSKKKFLNAAYECVAGSRDPAVVTAHREAAAAMSEGVFQAHKDEVAAAAPISEEGEKKAGFVLLTQFYFPDDLSLRQSVQEVLIRNLENDAIDEVYLICEVDYNFDELPNHKKITKFLLDSRLKFSDAFRVANGRLAGRSVIFSNSDIYFDDSLEELTRKTPLDPNIMLALSTWSRSGQSLSLNLRSDSQDAWVVTAPVPEEAIQQSNFYFGAPKCDNRIAKVFSDLGYRVKNPAFTVHAIELDNRLREGKIYTKVGEVLGEVVNVPLADNNWY